MTCKRSSHVKYKQIRESLETPGFFESLAARTSALSEGLARAAAEAGLPLATEAEGGMFGFVFTDDGPVRRFSQVAGADIERFKKFFHGMLNEGVYLAPSAFEAGFVSAAHGTTEIEQTISAARKVMTTL